MAATKTVWTGKSVNDFILEFANTEQKKEESFALIKLMQEVSGHPPKMWGPSIIGFGKYHYKYASGHEGEAPLLGFSPRKAAFSLYVFTGLQEHEYLLEGLGKYKVAKACIYVNKLSDINLDKLVPMMKASMKYIESKYQRL